MASTYALPHAPAARTHSHSHSHGLEHSPSHSRTRSHQYTPEQSPYSSSPLASAPPAHAHYDMNGSGPLHGAVRSPYAEYADLGHERAPARRLRGDFDSARTIPSPRRGVSSTKYGFSPIHEAALAPPSPATASQSWLELPEALTALLIPLPYLLASLAFPIAIGRKSKLPSTLSEAVAESAPPIEPLHPEIRAPLLHALILSSGTLLLVGVIAKISASLQPLDRRKAAKGTFVLKNAPLRISSSVIGILLPFYSAVQLGGSRTALSLLVAVAAGLHGPAQQAYRTVRETVSQSFRARKTTCCAMFLSIIADIISSGNALRSALGYGALVTSVMIVPPPLPVTTWGRATVHNEDLYINQGSARAYSQMSASPLVNSFESTLLTLVSGLLLAVVSILYYLATSSFSFVSPHTVGLSLLSIASATALIFNSLPAALQNQRYIGLTLGAICIAGFSLWEHKPSGLLSTIFLLICAVLVGTVVFDSQATPASMHSPGHSHPTHSHTHQHDQGHCHIHQLHGNYSRFSAFLIARATPGSIIHSVLIEKDSRRIAYFGVLNLAFMLVQFFYGFVSGSLGLLTDSIHMLFDCAGLAVGLAAAVMSKWRPNPRFPYGYGKIDTLSGFANGVFLLLVSVEIIFDAFERLFEGHELRRLNELLIVSILGFLVNIVGLTAFGHAHHGHGHDHGDHDHGHGHDHSHDNENMQGIFLHILADALGSVAVIISTLLTKYYGWSGWDPIASCIIAILIFLSAIPLVKSSGARLMLSLPNDLEYGIRNALGELGGLRGVVGYTVPKFWLEDAGAAHAEAHAKEEDYGQDQKHKHSHHGHANEHAHSHSHAHSHEPAHEHSHTHSHAHDHHHHHGHSHSHGHAHDPNHGHNHDHAAHKQRVLGVIHVIASRAADMEDVRERTVDFLKGRGMDVVVHVEREGEGRCWCGGGTRTN